MYELREVFMCSLLLGVFEMRYDPAVAREAGSKAHR